MSLHTGQRLQDSNPGSVPIMGTFAVNLPLITSTTPFYSTAVVLLNVTPDHAIVVQDMGTVSGASANSTGSSARILFSVTPQVGQVTLTYVNQGATVNASDKVYSYLAALK